MGPWEELLFDNGGEPWYDVEFVRLSETRLEFMRVCLCLSLRMFTESDYYAGYFATIKLTLLLGDSISR